MRFRGRNARFRGEAGSGFPNAAFGFLAVNVRSSPNIL